MTMRTINFFQRLLTCLAVLFLSCTLLSAQSGTSSTTEPAPTLHAFNNPPGNIDAVSWVLTDFPNGTVLYSKNEQKLIPPASLTKLMVLHLAYKAIEQDKITKDTLIKILPRHTGKNIPYGSSLMYLEAGYSITFFDLMKGAAITSGNDAAYLIAETLAGSVEQFVVHMNREAQLLGLIHTHFIEPTGLSEKNISSAYELAQFALYYVKMHPYALQELHNLPAATVQLYSLKNSKILNLKSTNELLTTFEGCDGLKTGYIRESGYNFITTAQRGNTRFILVTLGGRKGTAERAKTAEKLLSWAFSNWETIEFPEDELGMVRVWYGKKSSIKPIMSPSSLVTIENVYKANLTFKIIYEDITAPIIQGQQVGKLLLISDTIIVKTIPLVAPEDVPQGNIFIRIRDFFLKLMYSFFRKK